MEGSQMTGVNLRVATLKNAKLKNCNLRGATLAGTDLEVSQGHQTGLSLKTLMLTQLAILFTAKLDKQAVNTMGTSNSIFFIFEIECFFLP